MQIQRHVPVTSTLHTLHATEADPSAVTCTASAARPDLEKPGTDPKYSRLDFTISGVWKRTRELSHRSGISFEAYPIPCFGQCMPLEKNQKNKTIQIDVSMAVLQSPVTASLPCVTHTLPCSLVTLLPQKYTTGEPSTQHTRGAAASRQAHPAVQKHGLQTTESSR